MPDTLASVKKEVHTLKKHLTQIEKRLDEIPSNKEILISINAIMSTLEEIKPQKESRIWSKIGVFLLGGFCFFLLFVILGLALS